MNDLSSVSWHQDEPTMVSRRPLRLVAALTAGAWLLRIGVVPCSDVGFAGIATPRVPLRRSTVMHAAPETAIAGLRAQIHYSFAAEDGAVLTSTEGRDPVDFVLGETEILPAIEEAVIGLALGESRDMKYGDDKPIFGPRMEDRMLKVPIDRLPEGTKIGDQLMMSEGMPPVMVVEMGEQDATIDANHPLAGKALSLTVKLVSLEEVPESERVVVETVTPGDGKTFPSRGDKLTMHYTGTLASNDAQFDSSRDRGQPFTFQIGVGQVIPGWDKGVMKMSLGERAVLKIPSALGYGAQGAGSDIPPNADLVFDVELLAID
eukprot:gb/GFBE01026093.1/.p1 GENE.gb/GFBE01026093.1/~~gb/GFBE01026093.1/.p1  ORF type:complete len:319 (+),score=65.17 gb/GFBE01026093.1/:1-957(+)